MTHTEQELPTTHLEGPRTPSGWLRGWLPAAALVAVLIALRTLDVASIDWLNNFILVASSLLIEAVPFVLLGAIVSSAIEIWLPDDWFARIARTPKAAQIALASCGGMLFPVCECGSVPIANRLLTRGLTPAAAISFMLAAPIVNPVVILSTWMAFKGQESEILIVVGRVALGIGVAVAVGLMFARAVRDPGHLAAAAPSTVERVAASTVAGRDVHPTGDGVGRPSQFAAHVGAEFLTMMRYLIIGATVAAALQTFVPQQLISGMADRAWIAIPAMMLFAFVLSLCSESDAFFAASLMQFSPSAQLAFLVFGPMADTKLVALYSGTFGLRLTRTILVAAAGCTLIGALWLELLITLGGVS